MGNEQSSIPAKNVHPAQSFPVQTKLTVGAAGDKYEQEADAIANNIVNMNEGQAAGKTSATSFFQTKLNGEGATASESLTNGIQSGRGSGRRLDLPTNRFLSERLGYSVDHVNIHTGNDAAAMSKQLNAKAFTVGNDIYFDEGRYSPGTKEGKTLLAHEVVHTFQQGAKPAIQKDENKAGSTVDISFEALPPHLQLTLPHFLIDANTSRIKTQFTWQDLTSSLTYNYGSSIDLGLRYRAFSSQLGFNPSSSVLSLTAGISSPSSRFSLTGTGSYSFAGAGGTAGLTGSYRGVNIGGSYNFGTGAAGVNFGYGAPLLPTPAEMGTTFGAAGSAVGLLGSSLPGALNDPAGWYHSQSPNMDAVKQGYELFNRLREEPSTGIRFGAGGRLTYSRESGLFIFIGVQGTL